MRQKTFSRFDPKRLLQMGVLIGAAGLYAFLSGRILSANVLRYLTQIFLYIVLGEAWNLLGGFAGMTSLGQQMFIGLGGYAVAVVTSTWRMPFGWGLLLGAAAGILAALLLSKLLFRLWGMYFGISTWVAAEAMQKLFLNWRYVNQGGGMTVKIVPYPGVIQIHMMSFVLCAAGIAAVCWIMRSRIGLALNAIRDDTAAAQAIGINLSRNRLAAYLFSALLTALAGGIFFINKGVIYPDSGFDSSWTVSIVFICIIGGTGTIAGPVVGAVIYVLLREFLAHYPGWSNIILGLITITVIMYLPGGIIGAIQKRVGRRIFSFERRLDG